MQRTAHKVHPNAQLYTELCDCIGITKEECFWMLVDMGRSWLEKEYRFAPRRLYEHVRDHDGFWQWWIEYNAKCAQRYIRNLKGREGNRKEWIRFHAYYFQLPYVQAKYTNLIANEIQPGRKLRAGDRYHNFLII